MAYTGILLRRGINKSFFSGQDAPIPGELVMDLETTNFGFLSSDGTTIKWGMLEDELPKGGNIGQILSKSSNQDGDVSWIDPPQTGPTNFAIEIVTESGSLGDNTGYVRVDDDRSEKSSIGKGAIDLSFIDDTLSPTSSSTSGP